MKWFAGSINDAVTTSKQRKAIFVVFVEGKDETSSQVASAINETEVTQRLELDNFVAIKLESDGESYKFFQQIYQVVPVPSIFFIGENGSPLEIISGNVVASDLSKKIDAILEKVVGKDDSSEASANLIQAEKSVSGPSMEAATVQSVVPGTQEISNEEKLARAKQLIELQRQQKIDKEREDEKKREIERRKLGKDVQAAKQKQHEAEIKLAHDERMREKAAEAAARERVRQQIAQDKIDRKQRELDLQKQTAKQQQNQRVEPSVSTSMTEDGAIARIQFRLPSGSPHTGKFEAASTLGSLRSYVVSNIELPFQKFAMSTTFPRRDLTVEDDDKTLIQLELVPTAVILILPVKNTKATTAVTTSADVGFVSRFIWALFTPILSVYNYIAGYFTGTGPENRPEGRRGEANASGATGPNAERFARSAGQPSGLINRNIFGGPATTIRSRGNIHRLHTGSDDNDENNTWNGNSTQQM